MIYSHNQTTPRLGNNCYVAPSADIIGDVTLGDSTSIWYNATIRSDEAPITIGDGTNIQDNAVLHVTKGLPLSIGCGCTVGHGAILHSCTIGDDCLIGMGAIILDGAVIGKQSLVAAGSLVSPNKVFPPRSLLLGSPAKVARMLGEEEYQHMIENANDYSAYAEDLVAGRQTLS